MTCCASYETPTDEHVCVDEKTGIQALERRYPDIAMQPVSQFGASSSTSATARSAGWARPRPRCTASVASRTFCCPMPSTRPTTRLRTPKCARSDSTRTPSCTASRRDARFSTRTVLYASDRRHCGLRLRPRTHGARRTHPDREHAARRDAAADVDAGRFHHGVCGRTDCIIAICNAARICSGRRKGGSLP
jgi:hypothetical protein